MKYQLQKAFYEHLPNNDFKDLKTGEVVDIFDDRHRELMYRVEVGLHSEVRGSRKRMLYEKIYRLKKPPPPKPEPKKKEPLKYVVVGNVVIFDRKTRIQIPKGKTAEYIINKYKDIIYGKLE